MSKPFPLQSLLDLARCDSDSAAARLGALNRHDRDMEQLLQQLLEYRNEYTLNLARVAQTGMRSTDWQNFRVFIETIDAGIVQQRQAVAKARQNVQAGQHDWHAQQRKLKSFDTLSLRHGAGERLRDARQEQKEQDEFTLQGCVGRHAVMG